MPGAVENSAYRAWGNIKLPKYFLKLHETAPTGLGLATVVFSKIDSYGCGCKPHLPGLGKI